jgi:hypothetical protein
MFTEWNDYGIYEGGASSEAATDASFFTSAMNKINSFVAPIQDFSKTPVGAQLFDAIYAYGAGKIDAAREKAVGAFLMTSEGQRLQKEATRQTAVQYAPLIVLGVAAIFFLGILTFRR